MMRDLLEQRRYDLRAYVCGPECVHLTPLPFGQTAPRIHQQRPDGCRYAIVRRIPFVGRSGGRMVLGESSFGPYLCWDLLDLASLFGPDSEPQAVWALPTEEAAIMTVTTLYSKEHDQ